MEAEESDKSRKFKVIVDSLSFDTTLSRAPLFLGGRNFIYQVLGRNLIYPKKAREAGIQGKIIVKFIIDKYGNTRNYQVEKPIGYLLDEEAIRVLQLLPELWLPGELYGQAVDVEFVFPLRFEVN